MVKIGPSGNCSTFYNEGYKSTIEAPKWLNDRHLTAYEYSFARGVTITNSTCIAIGNAMKEYNIEISAHAPYYINFGNPLNESEFKSTAYILESLKKLKLMGGKRLVVHIGSTGKLDRNYVLKLIHDRLITLHRVLVDNNMTDMLICIETMGKYSQIGTYQEIVELCKLSPMYIPTFDFGHINCILQGGLKTKDDYIEIFNYSIKILGLEKINKCHIHFSKIEFSNKGELRHLDFDNQEYGPNFVDLAGAIKKLNLSPFIICESSGFQGRDATKMLEIYNGIK